MLGIPALLRVLEALAILAGLGGVWLVVHKTRWPGIRSRTLSGLGRGRGKTIGPFASTTHLPPTAQCLCQCVVVMCLVTPCKRGCRRGYCTDTLPLAAA